MATRSRNATEAVLALARQRPELGVVRAARELRKRGVRLSPSGVREIWGRHNLGRATSGCSRAGARATARTPRFPNRSARCCSACASAGG